MAKKSPGRPKTSERDYVTVKVDRALVSRAKLIANERGISVAELISDLLAGPLDRAFVEVMKELDAKGRK